MTKAFTIALLKQDIQNSKQKISYWHNEVGIEALEMAVKALEQTRWIPTSEKLPEEYVHVLCQFALSGMGECYLAHGLFHIVGGVRLSHDEIIAWMPLPHSYKLESEDSK